MNSLAIDGVELVVLSFLARHFGHAPDQLGPDEVRAYPRRISQEQRIAWVDDSKASFGGDRRCNRTSAFGS